MQRLEKYTLIVTEKPDAANRIASALDAAGKAKQNVGKWSSILRSTEGTEK